ncbi:hypothetical protein BPT24_203 [Tenacibaculum phage pT24]|uniref:Uncharacterized protein n=1 Tax=Tenacibaculum phage pT24 TaxID=1880590 RepID=A0A1B4XX04_9CAUD|nr:hypothetical protein HYP10_gp203 [Tenacibaculum phage pT24]BAV39327.1 hypothetical protein BPT24_203 [Tenacibaculum phage pT24]
MEKLNLMGVERPLKTRCKIKEFVSCMVFEGNKLPRKAKKKYLKTYNRDTYRNIIFLNKIKDEMLKGIPLKFQLPAGIGKTNMILNNIIFGVTPKITHNPITILP